MVWGKGQYKMEGSCYEEKNARNLNIYEQNQIICRKQN